jgi:hypothetical protein
VYEDLLRNIRMIVIMEGDKAMRESKRSLVVLLVVCCAGAILVGCNHIGYQGIVYERLAGGGIGPVIPGANIRFVSEDGTVTRTVVSGSGGEYKIALDKARYVVTATHPSYDDYSSAPGFFVVTGSGYDTGNIFMEN